MADSCSSGEAAPKKMRLDVPAVFREFWFKEGKRQNFKKAVDQLSNIGVSCLKILSTNAKSPVSFSKAICCVQEIWFKQDEEQFLAATSFSSLFGTGYDVLYRFLADGSLPENKELRDALQKLLHFLLHPEDGQPLFNGSSHYGSEKNWTLVLIQHLLSKLSVSTKILTDSATIKGNCCPCDKREIVPCRSENTSIGCVNGWRGELDIMIGEMPVKVVQSTEDRSDEEIDISNSGLSAEVKKDNFTKTDQNQMLAQTILFSFFKNDGLIPLVGLCSSFFKLYFYDCKQDILMRSNTVNFIYNEEKKIYDNEAILMLWLTLNYELFSSGVPDEVIDFKAKFHEESSSFLESYKNVIAPFPIELNAHVEDKEITYKVHFDSFKKSDLEYFKPW